MSWVLEHFQTHRDPALVKSRMPDWVRHFQESSKTFCHCFSLRAWWIYSQTDPGVPARARPLKKVQLKELTVPALPLCPTAAIGQRSSPAVLSAVVWNKAAGSCRPQVWGHRGWVWGKETCTHPEML